MAENRTEKVEDIRQKHIGEWVDVGVPEVIKASVGRQSRKYRGQSRKGVIKLGAQTKEVVVSGSRTEKGAKQQVEKQARGVFSRLTALWRIRSRRRERFHRLWLPLRSQRSHFPGCPPAVSGHTGPHAEYGPPPPSACLGLHSVTR